MKNRYYPIWDDRLSEKPGCLMRYLIQFHEKQRVWFAHLNLIFFSI